MDRETPGWSSAPAPSACNRSDLDKRRDPHRTLDSEPPTRMSDHTTGGTEESGRKIATHPSPRVHLLVDSMEATGWQKHTVGGFVSLLASKGGQSIESSKNAAGERTYKVTKQTLCFSATRRLGLRRGGLPA